MPTKTALKLKITAALPIDDNSPEAFSEAAKAVNDVEADLKRRGFVIVETSRRVGNVRVPDKPQSDAGTKAMAEKLAPEPEKPQKGA